MKRRNNTTCVRTLANTPKGATFLMKYTDAKNRIVKRLPIFSTYFIGIALSLLLVSLTLAPSMLVRRGGSVTAFSESIATYSNTDCSTSKTSWNLGETACAVATGATGPRAIVWYAPNGLVAQRSNFFTGTGSDSYTFQTTGSYAQVGTWLVRTVNPDGDAISSAAFTVHDPVLASADLSIVKSGPGTVPAGSSISYSVTVYNLGPDADQNVTFTDTTPANTTFVAATPASGFTCATVGGVTTCTNGPTGSLAANSSVSFTLVYTVDGAAPAGTVITNTASVTSSTNEPQSQRSDNSSTTEAVVSTAPSASPCTINCPADISANNDPQSANPCVAVVNYTTPTASGNCTDPDTGRPADPVSCSPPSGTAFPVGTTPVTCTNGVFACSFSVTVHETRTGTTPTITCPSNMTVPESSPGSGSATVTFNATATGNCPNVSCSPPSGSSFPVGTTTVNCTATDDANNTASCSFTITVTTSTGACTLTCSDDVTQAAPSGQCSAVVNYPAPSTSGNCGTVTCSPPSGSTFQTGTTTVTCTSDQGPSCTFTVTVTTSPPTITACAANRTISVNANCEAAIPNMTGEVQTTGCSVTVSQSPAAGTIVGPGTYTVTFTAENSGCDAGSSCPTCTATVTVVDTTPPVIGTCPAPTSANADSHCQAPVPDVTGGVTASDNCTPASSLTITQSPTAGTPVSAGTTTITITVKDASNNAATCTTTFTVNDTTPPTAVCKDATVALDANGNASITGSDVDGGSTDNCGITSRTVTPNTFTCANKGPNTVTLTVKDAANNSASCQATVTVVDNMPPTITCPANQTRNTDPNQCSAVVTYPNATASDNCPGVGTPSCTPPSGSTFQKGTTTVTCTVSDASSNSASCTFTVTVNDTQPPAITCPANQVRSTDPNQCSAVVAYPAPSASDNCPGVVAVCSPASGSTFPKGTTTVTCTATDTSNNSSSCSFTVTVNDTQPPAITCPANIVVEPTCPSGAVVSYTTPVGTDNCPGAVTTQTAGLASGSIFPIGTTTNTFKVTDTSGNFTTCSFTVKVKSPAEVIQDLMNRVQALMDQGVLSQSNGNALQQRLQQALDYINSGDTGHACDRLDSFIDKVTDYIQHGTLTSAQGQPLIDSAKNAQNGLGCKPVTCT